MVLCCMLSFPIICTTGFRCGGNYDELWHERSHHPRRRVLTARNFRTDMHEPQNGGVTRPKLAVARILSVGFFRLGESYSC